MRWPPASVLTATTSNPPTAPKVSARATALRALTMRRLTEAQLWQRLERRGYEDSAIRDAIARCKELGYLDDGIFAQLYVDGRRKPVGDARLVADLVRRGIAREAAVASVERAEHDQDARLAVAIERIYRRQPALAYPLVARKLERLGFPAPAIYRHLRVRAAAEFADVGEDSLSAHA
jgi:regulatory protein